jgi:importin-9
VPVKDPDQYTIIPAPLKILKLLIEELTSAQGKSGAASLEVGGSAAAAAAAEAMGKEASKAASGERADGENDDDDDSGWEDENDDILDLSLGATKNDLFSYLDSGPANRRSRDDETQAYLTEFFLRAAREDTGGFKGWYDQLTPTEQQKLNELA